MPKKVYIGESNLMSIKNAMASKNVSHNTFMSEEKPPYEEDEFEIGGEGGNNDFFHINETYGYSKTVDFSEVGKVEYQWDYFEDDYQEWLQEEGLQDSPEIKMEYIKDNVTFDVDFFDNQIYHLMGSEGGLFYDDLENVFGESMAERMLKDCMENGSGSFETFEMYENTSYDINNPQELNDIAMKLLPHGEYYKNCRGFILTNGVIVYTEGEHNDVLMIPGINNKFQFVELGNIRILDHSIDIGAEPTYEQEEVLRQILREYDGEEVYLDIFHDGEDIGVVYHSADYRYVMGEIDRFYSEGIRPQGGYTYENKASCQETINENTFENWFGNSILKDESGQPIKMYHGTDYNFNEFSKEYIGSHGSFEGYGFNFTPYESRARSYSSENVIEAYLRAENPMTTKSNKISLPQLIKIIKELDEGKPFTDTIVAAYEPASYNEKWDERYYRRALPVAARTIYNYNKESEYGDAGIYAELCVNGNADKLKVIEVFEKLGYDSAIFYDNYDKIDTVVVFEPNQIKKVSNKTFSVDSNIMDENIETEVEASEVKLDSFKKNNTLAPRIWDGFDLNPRARLKLLDIADDFWDYVNITWVKRKGIHLTGSICNFNWSKFSDIDLHLVVDFSEIDERKDFVQEYFDAKKNEWNNEHSNLKIFGYPVELYVEDINAETASGGLYDLEENDWIKKPSPNGIKSIGLDKYEIKDKSAVLMTKIDDLYDAFKATNDDAELREIGRKSHKLRDRIKKMRKFGLERGVESDSFNIIYKVLRRTGYMQMLWDLSSKLYDKLNSIGIDESVDRDNINIFELAKERFGVTYDIRECGYILPDGSMLDFSGRHMITGDTDSSHLKGRRSVDHREISGLNWDKDLKTRTNSNINMSDFIKKGAIRIHCSNTWSSINLFVKPTKEQINPLLRLIQYSKGNVTVEIGDGDNSYEYAEWDEANPRRVINDVIRYFDGETTNLVGNVTENKVITAYFNKCINLNEEIVADGSPDHNPFQKRWKHEREVLKNYIITYGEIMTSKENGKEYKVLYDTMLSSRLGINYCICIQWNSMTMEPGNVIYVRAFDKFTRRRFKPEFDTRGFDNIEGTYDDLA